MPDLWLMQWLARIELSVLSTAVREVWWVFPSVLVIHSLSMAMMAGFGTVVAIRVMGFMPAIAPNAPPLNTLPLSSLARFRFLLWAGLVAATFSGVVLLTAYPAKALTNPLFYIKLLILTCVSWLSLQFLRERWHAKLQARLAVLCLAGWVAVIFAGRFLAYTHTVLMASWLVTPTGG
jgi:hypothetical protein